MTVLAAFRSDDRRRAQPFRSIPRPSLDSRRHRRLAGRDRALSDLRQLERPAWADRPAGLRHDRPDHPDRRRSEGLSLVLDAARRCGRPEDRQSALGRRRPDGRHSKGDGGRSAGRAFRRQMGPDAVAAGKAPTLAVRRRARARQLADRPDQRPADQTAVDRTLPGGRRPTGPSAYAARAQDRRHDQFP